MEAGDSGVGEVGGITKGHEALPPTAPPHEGARNPSLSQLLRSFWGMFRLPALCSQSRQSYLGCCLSGLD